MGRVGAAPTTLGLDQVDGDALPSAADGVSHALFDIAVLGRARKLLFGGGQDEQGAHDEFTK
jgi:hypothetical protein